MKRKQGPKYYISRQQYWGVDEEEGTIVEIASGGSDYANPDMLGVKWPQLGEGQTFSDPREAVEAAIKVAAAWKANGNPNVKVGLGFTGGFTLPFEGQDADTLRHKAEEAYQKLPKCDQCGELLGDETFTHDLAMEDENFCSESCAEKSYQHMVADDKEFENERANYQ